MKRLLILFVLLIYANFIKSQDNITLPHFPGGDSYMYKFLFENTIYPEEALKKEIQGKTYVSFIVRKDGSLDSISVLQSSHFLLDAEAIRVVYLFPKWDPAYKDGKPIDFKYAIPFNFILDEEKDTSSTSTYVYIPIYTNIDKTGKFETFENAIKHVNEVVELRIGNALLKEIHADIDTFPNLELLDCSSSKIDKLPESFKNLDKVKYLSLRSCLFTEFPLEICDMESLEELDFGLNKIKTIPLELLNCKQLKTINLEYNSISKEEQKALKKQLKGIKLIF